MIINIIVGVILGIFFLFKIYQLIKVFQAIKGPITFPNTEKELQALRKTPEKPIKEPNLKAHRGWIILYVFTLTLAMVLCGVNLIYLDNGWIFTFIFLLPVYHASDLINLFAVTKDGIISGSRFIPWSRMKSFERVPVDVNHRFYGFAHDVNGSQEVKIRTNGFPLTILITQKDLVNTLIDYLEQREIKEWKEIS